MRIIKLVFFFLTVAILAGCIGGGGSSSDSSTTTSTSDATSTNFPYLLSTPKVTFIQNVYDTSQYDVTVELDATGPNPIYSVNLWINSKDDSSVFANLDLQNVGGTKWSGATYSLTPLPAGHYYLDSIMIEDGDSFAGGQVRSGWYYQNTLLSTTHYCIDQRLTDWSAVGILEYNYGVSGIPVINFTMP